MSDDWCLDDVLLSAWRIMHDAIEGREVRQYQVEAAKFVLDQTMGVEGGPWLPGDNNE